MRRAEIIRQTPPRMVQTTTYSVPSITPITFSRSSPSSVRETSSSTRLGSTNACVANGSVTLCLTALPAAFASSHSKIVGVAFTVIGTSMTQRRQRLWAREHGERDQGRCPQLLRAATSTGHTPMTEEGAEQMATERFLTPFSSRMGPRAEPEDDRGARQGGARKVPDTFCP